MLRGPTEHESEWLTRKRRIDPRLDARGWRLGASTGSCRTEEEDTDHGPADYALWLGSRVARITTRQLRDFDMLAAPLAEHRRLKSPQIIV